MSTIVPMYGFGGSGGGGLNFKVVGGTTQPTNPTENAIWVNTSVSITDWVFSATEPEGYAHGMVWFSTGTSSAGEFNALKKNGIQVYPISAKQYVSGAWANVEAYIQKDGELIQFSLLREYFIKDGVELIKNYSLYNSTLKTNDGIWYLTGSNTNHFAANYKLDGYGGKSIFVEVVDGRAYETTSYATGILVNTSPITSGAVKPAYVAQTLFDVSSSSSIKSGIYELKIPSDFSTGYFSIHAEPAMNGYIKITNAWFE